MDTNNSRVMDIKIEIVKKEINNCREHWGKWTLLRKKLYSIAIGQTVKTGPFPERREATLARANVQSSGASLDYCKNNNCTFVSSIELEDDQWYLFIQKKAAQQSMHPTRESLAQKVSSKSKRSVKPARG